MWPLEADPTPRSVPNPYTPIKWEISECRSLPVPDSEALASTAAMLDARHSERIFSPVPESLIGALFWHVTRTKETASSLLGFHIEHRPIPSAGAIHPIHLVIQLADEGGWARYHPQEHRLDLLAMGDQLLRPLVNHSEQVVPLGGGHLILFVAEPGKTAAKYENVDSLIWRDAGILQGSLALVAAALGLNYCLLGITGNPWAAQLSNQGKLQGVGVAILGTKP